MKSLSFVIRTF